tara:strand:- start:1298 stop:1528 length:231 start_codon:yes stop_codon:yes gene_type:complete
MQYKKIPDALKPEHLTFLDDLRESGVVNMFGAIPYLTAHDEDLGRGDAIKILQHWMDTFSERQRDKKHEESKPEAE